jgi:hypothetical protein
MDELIALVGNRQGPAAACLGFVKEDTVQFRCDLVGGSLGGCRVGQVHSFPVPDKPILGAQVEIEAGHWHLRVRRRSRR